MAVIHIKKLWMQGCNTTVCFFNTIYEKKILTAAQRNHKSVVSKPINQAHYGSLSTSVCTTGVVVISIVMRGTYWWRFELHCCYHTDNKSLPTALDQESQDKVLSLPCCVICEYKNVCVTTVLWKKSLKAFLL